jgi:hypothetical protein
MTYYISIDFCEILSRMEYRLELAKTGRWTIENEHGLICWSGEIGKCRPMGQSNRINKIIRQFLRRD